MLRALGITSILRWVLLAMVAVAVWQGFNGNIPAIVDAVWNFILAGADILTNIYHSLMGAHHK